MSVLPGEPTDGTGRTCIHLFVQDENGPITEKHVLLPVFEDGVQVKQQAVAGAARGLIACDPKRRSVAPVTRGNVTTVTQRTDDPRAVSCEKCKASVYYKKMMEAKT